MVLRLIQAARGVRAAHAASVAVSDPDDAAERATPQLGAEGMPPDTTTAPPRPMPSANPGPLEAQVRASLPEDIRLGFDDWMAEMRRNDGNPEDVRRSCNGRFP